MKQVHLERLSRRLLTGGISADPVNQRHLDYQRGFFAALDALKGAPETAEKALEIALSRQEKHERV